MSDFYFQIPTGGKWQRGIANFRASRRGGSRTARRKVRVIVAQFRPGRADSM
jgi:hypothetical protein